MALSVAAVILMFYFALERLPLGVAISLQFLGPLSLAVIGSRRLTHVVWAVLAGAGVWWLVGTGTAGAGAATLDPIAWALRAAAGWAAYILFGRAASAAFGQGTAALALTIDAVFVLHVGIYEAGAALLAPDLLPIALVMALFSAAIPFTLECYAPPRLPARTFAVFTSLEPAFGVLAGLLILNESLPGAPLGGVAVVIVAAACAGRVIPLPADAPALCLRGHRRRARVHAQQKRRRNPRARGQDNNQPKADPIADLNDIFRQQPGTLINPPVRALGMTRGRAALAFYGSGADPRQGAGFRRVHR